MKNLTPNIANWRKRITKKFLCQLFSEFIGTMFLTEMIGCIIANKSNVTTDNSPIGIGWSLAILVFSLSHISGANLNPAVSWALVLRRALEPFDGFCYVIAQLFGGLFGAGLARGLSNTNVTIRPLHGYNTGQSMSAEIFFTFLLCHVVLNVCTVAANKQNQFYGIAIGLTVTASVYAVGDISGGAFNPAVATGLASLGGSSNKLWIYWIGEFLGSNFAVATFYLINFEEIFKELQVKKGVGYVEEVGDRPNSNELVVVS